MNISHNACRTPSLLGALVLALLAGQLGPQVRAATSERTALPRFGVVEAFWSPEQAAALDPDWERILFYWSEIQPEGPGDWNTLHVREEWLEEAGREGREVVGLLKHTPAWATDGVVYGGVPRGLYLPVDDPDNLWAAFVRRVATYYSERGIHRWIVWNEPDIEPGVFGNEWEGSVADYYRLVKVASQVMKAEDPAATIHLAGLTYWHDATAGRTQYLERFLEVAAQDPEGPANGYFFDIISLHIYFRVETVASIVNEMDAVQQQFGLEKPIWINETNAAPTLDPEWPVDRPRFQVDLEQQAWFIVQAHALGFAAGADSIGVYKFSDVLLPPGGEAFGLLRGDFSERPAFAAHRTTIQYLSGFEDVELSAEPNYYVVTFHKPSDIVRVLWARTTSAVDLALPAYADEATIAAATGEERTEAALDGNYVLSLAGARCYDACLIGGPPWFVVEAKDAVATPQAEDEIVPTVSVPPPQRTPATEAASTLTPLPSPVVLAEHTATPPAPNEPSEDAQVAGIANWIVVIPGLGALVLVGYLIWKRSTQ